MSLLEFVMMVANIATALALFVAIIVLIQNKGAVVLQRKSIQADLFLNISSEINALFIEEKDHVSTRRREKKPYENWSGKTPTPASLKLKMPGRAV